MLALVAWNFVGRMEPSIAYTWGSTAQERQMVFPCDRYMSDSDDVYFRAIAVQAPAHILFRWLCQLKVASYSYDSIDKLERVFFKGQERIPNAYSPQELTPGTETLAPEQRFMGVFKLVEFEQNRHLTIILDSPLAIAIFGDIAASYVIFPLTDKFCRLVLKGHVRYPRNSFWAWIRWVEPWGDLLMMRKQFFRLKHLAENEAARNCENT